LAIVDFLRAMNESERVTELIASQAMDNHLVIALLEIARQIALLHEALSDLRSEAGAGAQGSGASSRTRMLTPGP
jgi:hypothetical protein